MQYGVRQAEPTVQCVPRQEPGNEREAVVELLSHLFYLVPRLSLGTGCLGGSASRVLSVLPGGPRVMQYGVRQAEPAVQCVPRQEPGNETKEPGNETMRNESIRSLAIENIPSLAHAAGSMGVWKTCK
jgi:hypothetical protein